MFDYIIRSATEKEASTIKFRNEHEEAGNRKNNEEVRLREARLDKILNLLDTTELVAVEFNGSQAKGSAYEEQTKLVDLARRRRGITLRTRTKDSASGTTLYLKREVFNVK